MWTYGELAKLSISCAEARIFLRQAQEVSGSLQSTILVLAELGMLYRRVYTFVRVAQAAAGASVGAGGMTEQVRRFGTFIPARLQH